MNNPNMINPNPQMQQNYNPYQTLPFVLVQDMAMANSYTNGVTGSYSLRPGFKYEYSGHMPERMPEYSYRRGRSMTTGRYVSRGDHYSGHSIYDILIANMELTYNDCKSEHDEKIIDTAIRMVNQNR